MATTTPNYGWTVPTSTDLVKDGATAIETLGDAIDASMNTALGTKKAGMVLLNTTSFSAVSSQDISNVFSSTYDSYKIIISLSAGAANAELRMRLLDSGGTAAITNYSFGLSYSDMGSAFTGNFANGTGQTSFHLGQFVGTSALRTTTCLDLVAPFLTSFTSHTIQNASYYSSSRASIFGGGFHETSASYTGLRLIASTGTMTGFASVYGYNK